MRRTLNPAVELQPVRDFRIEWDIIKKKLSKKKIRDWINFCPCPISLSDGPKKLLILTGSILALVDIAVVSTEGL